jgi:hypothetical protein
MLTILLRRRFRKFECDLCFRREIPASGIVVSVVLTPDGLGAVVQLADGTLFLYKLGQGEMVQYSKLLHEACDTLQV